MSKRIMILFMIGVLFGVLTFPIEKVGAASNYFAGYYYSSSSVVAVRANIPYANPSVTDSPGFTTEWVMAVGSSASYYTQAGWIKYKSDSKPVYFDEYAPGCGGYCRFRYGNIDTNAHEYKVAISGQVFCGYIDGAQYDCSNGGFTTTSNEQYFGESTSTSDDIGGTSSSHLRMTYPSVEVGSTWYQVNTNSLTGKDDASRYHIDKGFTSPYSWIDNWTA